MAGIISIAQSNDVDDFVLLLSLQSDSHHQTRLYSTISMYSTGFCYHYCVFCISHYSCYRYHYSHFPHYYCCYHYYYYIISVSLQFLLLVNHLLRILNSSNLSLPPKLAALLDSRKSAASSIRSSGSLSFLN